jgi:hypothetical protein
MFPLAVVFLAAVGLATDSLRRNKLYAIVAALVFAVIAAPLAAVISVRVGRPTFSETGRLNYLWHVTAMGAYRFGAYRYWRGDPAGSGTPKHPMRLLSDRPRLYEFAAPVGGTYPLWYDPAYWYAGATTRFDIKKQIWRLQQSARFYGDQFGHSFQPLLLGGLLVLSLIGGRAASGAALSNIVRRWPLWGPSLAGLAFYAAVWVETRYVAAFVLVLWLCLFAATRIPGGARSQRWNGAAIVTLVAVVLVPTMMRTARDFARGVDPEFDAAELWQYARAMRRLGVSPGDAIGVIGDGFTAARWARLARVRIIAELPDEGQFWNASPGERARLLALFEKTGAKAVFTDSAPAWSAGTGWHTLGGRNWAAFVFCDSVTPP